MVEFSPDSGFLELMKLYLARVKCKNGHILLFVVVHAHWVHLIRVVGAYHLLAALLIGRDHVFLLLLFARLFLFVQSLQCSFVTVLA